MHKAIAREPGQRYASAQALADDLNRFLEGRPILARRVSTVGAGLAVVQAQPLAGRAVGGLAAGARERHDRLVDSGRAGQPSGRIAESEATRARGLAADLQASLTRSNRLAADLKTSLEVSERRRMALNSSAPGPIFERGRAACERGEIGPGLLYLVESWRSAVEARDPGLSHAARASLSAWRHQAPRLLRQFPTPTRAVSGMWPFSPDGKARGDVGNDKIGPALGRRHRRSDRLTDAAPRPSRCRGVQPRLEDRAHRGPAADAQVWDAATGRPIGPPLTHQGVVLCRGV